MATSWNIQTRPTNTPYSTRTEVNTPWSLGRLGGAYLMNSAGEYILTSEGKRIIVLVSGGSLSTTPWATRIIP